MLYFSQVIQALSPLLDRIQPLAYASIFLSFIAGFIIGRK